MDSLNLSLLDLYPCTGVDTLEPLILGEQGLTLNIRYPGVGWTWDYLYDYLVGLYLDLYLDLLAVY